LRRLESKVLGFMRRRRHERLGFELYGAIVAAAREPFFYRDLGVADTLDGRFDLVGLHAFLVIRRLTALPPPGPETAQAVFDAMFADMDINLREMGVSDLTVGKRVKAMWEAFHGRATAYAAALEAGDDALAEALVRNVWRGQAPAGGAPVRLAAVVRRHARVLDEVPQQALLGGTWRFPAPQEALA
jgi:cytochrome b pre-mRNA-processing protein 3